MVPVIDSFREKFKDYTDYYTIIGGTACDILLTEAELLDEYDRNDSIFITRNRNGITVEKLSNILKRNDIKKNDAYRRGFLEGTTPTYEAYMQLKKSIAASLA